MSKQRVRIERLDVLRGAGQKNNVVAEKTVSSERCK